jgi:hypothetical protein
MEEGFDSSNASRLSDKAGKEFIAYVEKKIEEKK